MMVAGTGTPIQAVQPTSKPQHAQSCACAGPLASFAFVSPLNNESNSSEIHIALSQATVLVLCRAVTYAQAHGTDDV